MTSSNVIMRDRVRNACVLSSRLRMPLTTQPVSGPKRGCILPVAKAHVKWNAAVGWGFRVRQKRPLTRALAQNSPELADGLEGTWRRASS